MRPEVVQRFEKKVERVPECGCWIWNAAGEKYGVFWDGEKLEAAHRIAWRIFKGPIPEGMHIDHTCLVEACVNPSHLEPVTQQENNRRTNERGRNGHSAKTHCPKGHPYEGDNLRLYRGSRFCRACHNVHANDWYHKNK